MNLKRLAAQKALDHVKNGMVLGLGTGSTSTLFVDLLAEKVRAGFIQDIRAVPTSEKTASHALASGIPLTTLTKTPRLDLSVDGADEVDPELNLIKGLGRALLREKIVHLHSDQFLVIMEETKWVSQLGTKVPLPVEILPFEAESHVRWLSSLGCDAELLLEAAGTPAVTDNGNYLALCHFPQGQGISDPHALARVLADRAGIIEHGLFLNMAAAVISAGVDGVRVTRKR